MIRIVELYKTYFQNNSFINYIKNKNVEFDEFWFLNPKHSSKFLSKSEIIVQEIKCTFLLVTKLRLFQNKKTLSFGGQFSLLFITKLFGEFLGSNYHLYMYNFYLHGSGKKKVVKLIMRFLLNSKRTTLIVQSPDEVNFYTPLSKNTIHFIPFCEDPDFMMDYSKAPNGDYLFTGGYTNRDYSLIFECAKLNPSVQFVVVISRLNKKIFRENLPDNITIFEEIDKLTFNGLMYKSRGVIIPLKENVGASGQMLCLGAMKMSKPIIYCDISSINYYFSDNDCGIPYTMGDINSLNNAVKKIFSKEFDSWSMGERAFTNFSENYTLEKRNESLLSFILKKNTTHL